jgi:hypothetical protein
MLRCIFAVATLAGLLVAKNRTLEANTIQFKTLRFGASAEKGFELVLAVKVLLCNSLGRREKQDLGRMKARDGLRPRWCCIC